MNTPSFTSILKGAAQRHGRLASMRGRMKRAFTLLETLVAITILLIAVTGPMVIVSQALKQSYYARDQITAFYLAQEAIEYIRNQRDDNGLQGSGASPVKAGAWLTGVGVDPQGTNLINAYGSTNIKADLTLTSGGVYQINACPQSGCSPMLYDPSGAYAYGSQHATVPSQFTREIILSQTEDYAPASGLPSRAIDVQVTVYWNTGGLTNKVVLREEISNWQLEK